MRSLPASFGAPQWEWDFSRAREQLPALGPRGWILNSGLTADGGQVEFVHVLGYLEEPAVQKKGVPCSS